jgi:hypothetical protein
MKRRDETDFIQCCTISEGCSSCSSHKDQVVELFQVSNRCIRHIDESGLPTFCPAEEDGRLEYVILAYLKNLLVAPFFAQTTNSTLHLAEGW